MTTSRTTTASTVEAFSTALADAREASQSDAASKASAVRVAEPAISVTTDGRAQPTFASDTGFHKEVKRRVQDHFADRGVTRRGNCHMYLKTAVLLLWFGGSYALLVFWAATWWAAALLSFSLALAWAGIGFAVQHDANHGAYSSNRVVNRLLGMTLDVLGGSSYIWHWKHNISHHTYTNLDGADNDINVRPFARLCPAQPRNPIHRFQHFYMWALYGFLHPQWQVEDITQLLRARIGQRPFPRPRGWNLVQLISGKVAFVGWAFVVPALLHSWWVVILFYATTSMVLGVVLSVVFQLSHCVEEAEFPGGDQLPSAWAVHQVRSTIDFAQDNPILTWYLGGLNFQIEHHLFPRVCHVHYPRVAKIVRATCAEFKPPPIELTG
jgi:linoleoyl-CoA desaturase